MGQPLKRDIDPIAAFIQEHEVVLGHIRNLNKIATSIYEEGVTPEILETLAESMDFIREEVEVHNRREEEALFPVVERYVDGPTRSLKEDHRHLADQFEVLEETVSEIIANKENKEAVNEFVSLARRIVQIMVNHVHKENHILFPMLQRFLTKDELREISRKML